MSPSDTAWSPRIWRLQVTCCIPIIFENAAILICLVSKTDLLPYLPFSVDAVIEDARSVNPDIDVLEISTLKNVGMDAWANWIVKKYEEKKQK